MLTLRRALGLLLLALLVVVGYTGWATWQVKGDLESAQESASALEGALRTNDMGAAEQLADDLRSHAASAANGTDGAWWSALIFLPMVGDDLDGVRALTASLNTLAVDAVDPLISMAQLAEALPTGSGLSIPVIEQLARPVEQAAAAASAAAAQVEDLDSSGFAGVLQPRFDDYVEAVTGAESALRGAEKATGLLPRMLGASGPRDYLVVFQNNAEIRPTGGMPGSFARLRAANGRLTLLEQGGAVDFGERSGPVLPLTEAELEVYGRQFGTYFQDANFTPHFPRAAELMAARWEEETPGSVELDGVISLDPVAMSFLLEGMGPVQVQDQLLTSDNAVQVLLADTYVKRDILKQDEFFADATSAIFDAITGDLVSPLAFVQGLNRATGEGRLLVASFDDREQQALAGTSAAGELPGNAESTPYVDVTLSDGTASKMSYFLRYDAEVKARKCVDGVQELSGSLVMHQTITPREAERLGESVTGPADSAESGEQLVFTRLYGPVGGSIDRLMIDGESFDVEPVELDGRPVVTMLIALTSRQRVLVTWQMVTGAGQTGDGKVGVTPSIVPGKKSSEFDSAC